MLLLLVAALLFLLPTELYLTLNYAFPLVLTSWLLQSARLDSADCDDWGCYNNETLHCTVYGSYVLSSNLPTLGTQAVILHLLLLFLQIGCSAALCARLRRLFSYHALCLKRGHSDFAWFSERAQSLPSTYSEMTSTAQLNSEPWQPESRAEQNLPPKSYAAAVTVSPDENPGPDQNGTSHEDAELKDSVSDLDGTVNGIEPRIPKLVEPSDPAKELGLPKSFAAAVTESADGKAKIARNTNSDDGDFDDSVTDQNGTTNGTEPRIPKPIEPGDPAKELGLPKSFAAAVTAAANGNAKTDEESGRKADLDGPVVNGQRKQLDEDRLIYEKHTGPEGEAPLTSIKPSDHHEESLHDSTETRPREKKHNGRSKRQDASNDKLASGRRAGAGWEKSAYVVPYYSPHSSSTDHVGVGFIGHLSTYPCNDGSRPWRSYGIPSPSRSSSRCSSSCAPSLSHGRFSSHT